MSKVFIVGGLLAAVLFLVSAASMQFVVLPYFQAKDKDQHADAGAGGQDTGKELPPLSKAAPEGAGRPRPGYGSDAELVLAERGKEREREKELAQREQQVEKRRRALEIIQQDIHAERDDIDAVRKQISEEVGGLGKTADALDAKKQQIDDKMREEAQLVKDAKKGVYEVEGVRSKGVQLASGIYDTAEPVEVARIFENMVESGGLMTAAQILAGMKERRAAAVLSAMQDKSTAAQLTEKIIGLKQAPAPAKPLGGPAARSAIPPTDVIPPR